MKFSIKTITQLIILIYSSKATIYQNKKQTWLILTTKLTKKIFLILWNSALKLTTNTNIVNINNWAHKILNLMLLLVVAFCRITFKTLLYCIKTNNKHKPG